LLPWRILLVVILLAPMAVLMGMPFPFGLMQLAKSGDRIIPWVWAVNGSVSVIASVLAAILILSYGFMEVQLGGGLLYGFAALVYITSAKDDDQGINAHQ